MSQQEKENWEWVPPRNGVFRDIYANIIHPSWTLFDVRVRLGQLIPAADYKADFVIEEQGTVTMSWHEAKILRDALSELIAAYEKTNGELKPQKITPAPAFFESSTNEESKTEGV
jgi:hypothetical protein